MEQQPPSTATDIIPATPATPRRGRPAKHGLHARAIVVLSFETEEGWHTFRQGALEHFKPVGLVESALAERIAEYLWLGRRVAPAQAAAVAEAQLRDDAVQAQRAFEAGTERARSSEVPDPDWKRLYAVDHYVDAHRGPRIMASSSALDDILRFEAHINRQLFHMLHELEAMQARRKGGAAPLARVDVQGLSGT